MLSFFRRILRSKFGVFISLAFLAIIAFAFAAGDITNLGGMSGIGGSGGVAAKAGGETLTVTELQSRAQRAFEQQRSQNPTLQIGEFIAQGGVEQVFDQMVAGVTVSAYADDQGMAVSKRMVDAEIASIPAFQDASGKFSETLFRQLLAREGIQEPALRADIARDLIGKQLIGPAGLGVQLGRDMVLPYASLLLEARSGRIAAIPAGAFAPKTPPTDAQVQAYYTKNADRYSIPEQRRLRYAVIDSSRFVGAATPTDAEIAAYYAQNKASYAARETRSFDRLVMPTEAAAKAIAAEVKGGKSMAQAAQAAGLAVATLKDQSRDAMARDGNAALAQAAFAAPTDAVVGPVRTPLGWQVLRVTAINGVPERTLAQVRPEIIATLRTRKTEQLLGDFTGKIEDQVGDGATFDDVAKDNGLAVETSRLVISTGQDVQDTIFQPGPDLKILLKPGFDMSADDDAQLVPLVPGQRYALLDVADIVAPAPPPLAKVRAIIAEQYLLSLGAAKAKQVADQIRVQVAKGTPLDAALKSTGVTLPAPQTVAGRRADLLRGQQRPSPEIALLFAMTPKSVKTLDLPGGQGTLVVVLDQIQRADAASQPALVERVRGQFVQVVGGEYADQFERAMEKRLRVKRDAAAIEKAKQALRTANGVTP
ncbi:SurA N-terminal domain-containing protein [Sphingobium algorifonticola]|uniref:Parvulin-like PPIase n=1 Tax=Sphingobium algorifonticola TaxID=2008318 RepID=A0A437J841_9SPHN|nr:SurA N-terminal domain-containing protein [Sphingobium algorifonticola]RVT41184.1 peptidylprolyl isomerase [Sphingobium algorifonticola]